MSDSLTPEQIRRAKDNSDLVEMVRSKVELKRSGAKWTGRCPFHQEKSPSFYVDPARKTYICFGCGAKGDAIQWLRETEHLNFREAVTTLLKRLNLL